MPFKIICGKCQKEFAVPDSAEGKSVKCVCGEKFLAVRMTASETPPPVPPIAPPVVETVEVAAEDTSETFAPEWKQTKSRHAGMGDFVRIKSHKSNITVATFLVAVSIILLVLAIAGFEMSETIFQQIICILLSVIASMGICTGLILSKLNQILNQIKQPS